MKRAIHCVLLAAGFSRRFGENKLLFSVENVPLFRRTFDTIPPRLFPKAAVVSQYEIILKEGAALGYVPICNPLAAEGIAASVRLGLSAVMDGADGVLFAVCDQPYLRTESIQKLLQKFEENPEKIVALSAENRRGNPVIFPAEFFSELLALSGDIGGGSVIKKHLHRLVTVEVPPRELEDVDYRL